MVYTQLTNGIGNNLFQYIAGRMLSAYHDQQLVVLPSTKNYYGIDELNKIGIEVSHSQVPQGERVNDLNYASYFNKNYSNSNFYVSGYFENYKFFKNNINTIRSWFPQPQNKNDNDLVLHFRAGDRLFYSNEFDSKPQVHNFINAIEQFDFDKLHIVTDMPAWKNITAEELESMKFHVDVPPNKRVKAQESIDYFNSIVDGFAKYEPQIEKRTVIEDFNFIRGFSNILFQHGTLCWWAAMLSDAKKVGVYGPWRPWKGSSNKNLSDIDIEGWFKWE